MDTAVSVELFVEILNRYVYYFDRQNEAVSYSQRVDDGPCTDEIQVTTKYLNGLIELIHSNLNGADASAVETPKKHFERTLEYIASREFEGIVTEPH